MSTVTTPVRTGRLTSLDVVRGLMLVVSVGVNSLLVTPEWFEHAKWTGVHGLDLVFPVFVTLTGCGLGFAMHRRTDVGGLARRVVVLVAVGLLYNALVLDDWDLATWRLPGVLQLYAAVVALVALGHLVTRSWRGWALATVLLAAAHTVLLAGWATTCPGGALTPECNPSGAVDVAVFGAQHVYALGVLGHDPEGLVSILGALVSAAAGATVGHLLLAVRDAGHPPARAVLPVTGLAVAAVVLAVAAAVVPGLVTGSDVPAMKRLWSAPFSLSVAAGVAVVLLLVHVALDRPATPAAARAATWPLVALGRNSLLVYFGSHVVMSLLAREPEGGGESTAARIAGAVSVGGHDQLSLSVLAVLAWASLAAVLHRSRIYLRP